MAKINQIPNVDKMMDGILNAISLTPNRLMLAAIAHKGKGCLCNQI